MFKKVMLLSLALGPCTLFHPTSKIFDTMRCDGNFAWLRFEYKNNQRRKCKLSKKNTFDKYAFMLG